MIFRDQEIALVSDSFSCVLALVRVTINSCRGRGPSQLLLSKAVVKVASLSGNMLRVAAYRGDEAFFFFFALSPGKGGGGEKTRRGYSRVAKEARLPLTLLI